MEELHAAGIALDFRSQGGAIAALRVTDGGTRVAPLHPAPWADADLPAGSPLHLHNLAGDFFCAPFGDGSVDAAPLHGWTANANWSGAGGDYQLDRPVMGATVTKHLRLRDGHPFVYQRHVFTGGAGALPVANHAMVAVRQGARITTSQKRWFETPDVALETDPARGRSLLAYPARGDLAAFPLAGGGLADLGTYPVGVAHEDFVIAVEAPGHALGWTAVARAEGDLFLSLRRADLLPLTMFWHSNGGRHYAPWSSRHKGVLGVEEGVGLNLLGLSSSAQPDPLTAAGQPVALPLGGVVEVRHVIGAVHWPTAEAVSSIAIADGMVTITGVAGGSRKVPFDADFLGL
ncbi:MAG: hypothetical protein ACRC6I_06760 [Paracoccaceae bacterium]